MRWHAPRDGTARFWVLTRYTDVMAVSKDSRRCISTRGDMLGVLRMDVAATEFMGPVQRLEPHIGTGVSSPPVPLMRRTA